MTRITDTGVGGSPLGGGGAAAAASERSSICQVLSQSAAALCPHAYGSASWMSAMCGRTLLPQLEQPGPRA